MGDNSGVAAAPVLFYKHKYHIKMKNENIKNSTKEPVTNACLVLPKEAASKTNGAFMIRPNGKTTSFIKPNKQQS